MKCLIAFIFLASLLGACTSVSEKKGTSNKDLHNEIDSISIVDPNKKIIKWKLNGMAELLKDTLDFSLPNLNNCEYEWQNDSYISIRSSCGSPCWYSYLFPKRNGLKLKRYFYSIGDRKSVV